MTIVTVASEMTSSAFVYVGNESRRQANTVFLHTLA